MPIAPKGESRYGHDRIGVVFLGGFFVREQLVEQRVALFAHDFNGLHVP